MSTRVHGAGLFAAKSAGLGIVLVGLLLGLASQLPAADSARQDKAGGQDWPSSKPFGQWLDDSAYVNNSVTPLQNQASARVESNLAAGRRPDVCRSSRRHHHVRPQR